GNPSNGIDRSCDLGAIFTTGLAGLNQPPNVVPSEMLRLNMSIPPCQSGTCSTYSRFGVVGGDDAGFPNGRRLADDVIDVSVQVMEGCLLTTPTSCGLSNGLQDGVNANPEGFRTAFPYEALPTSGSNPNPH